MKGTDILCVVINQCYSNRGVYWYG